MPGRWKQTLERRAQRAEAAAEARRRDLRERYPDLPAQVFNGVGDGISGAGMRALRVWLRSVDDLVQRLPKGTK